MCVSLELEVGVEAGLRESPCLHSGKTSYAGTHLFLCHDERPFFRASQIVCVRMF